MSNNPDNEELNRLLKEDMRQKLRMLVILEDLAKEMDFFGADFVRSEDYKRRLKELEDMANG